MKNFAVISDIIDRVYQLVKKDFPNFPDTARAVRETINDMGFYSQSMIAIKTAMTVVKDNMTIDYPDGAASITKIGRIIGKSVVVLDKGSVTPTKESYALEHKQSGKCANCTCQVDCQTPEQFGSLPDAAQVQSVCDGSTFFNCMGQSDYLYGCRSSNAGKYHISGQIISFEGIPIGTEVLIEYKAEKDKARFLMIPEEAFKAIYWGALTFLDRKDQASEARFREYKHRFDLLKAKESYSPETVIRILSN